MWFSAIAIESMSLYSTLRYSPSILILGFNSAANEFSFTVTQINWFSNAINIIYIPVSCFVPYLSGRFGVRTSVDSASCFFLKYVLMDYYRSA